MQTPAVKNAFRYALYVLAIIAAYLIFTLKFPVIPASRGVLEDLSVSFRGKSKDEVRAAIIKRFGPALRNVGSGTRIEQWDILGGTLTFHRGMGCVYNDAKSGRRTWLTTTHNPTGANIPASYEMTTLPDAANRGTTFWIGNVDFGPNSTYQFTDSDSNRSKRSGQTENFFMLHPAGTVEIHYVAPVIAETLLESVGEGATVAHLVFTSTDHKQRATFSIASSERERTLEFRSEKPISFQLSRLWTSFWE